MVSEIEIDVFFNKLRRRCVPRGIAGRELIPTGQGATLVSQCASVTKMIDAVVSSSDAVAVAAGAGKLSPGGPTRIDSV